MELLPIIYWSLVGVGVLAVVVIAFSYITFQIRKKMGNIPSEEVKGKDRVKKVKITNPDKKVVKKKAHHPKVQTRSKSKERKASSSTSSKKKEEDTLLYKRPTKDAKRKRIEIINEPGSTSAKKYSKNESKDFHPMSINSKRDGWN